MATHELMQIIINDYERGLDSTSYDNLREQMNVSRIMLELCNQNWKGESP
jgi:hypothetical protein